MARKRDDAALHLPLPEERQVTAFLQAHPDFLVRHPDLLLSLSPPSRWADDDGVLDMQVFMIDRLRDEVERVRGAAEHLIHTSRSNMSIQTRTHRAVLSILGAESMAELVEAISDDLPALLDVDVATLCFEKSEEALPDLLAPGILTLPGGTVAQIMGGADRDCALTEEMPGDPALFGDGAGLVQSSAVVRLSPGGKSPDGVMALGSRHGRTFHAGQATELITFLARVVEGSVRRFVG
ncbi:hypothetical protein CCC_00493 [Paramagnetospirillum magnetotacticum MS-1]|uniref:DUF484 family protein n=1 Tax=Paramagnetospirillum magnetotacticum MS-1 TaxID=272627 RepID=A0A0C2U7I3_PARME|nr:DUF484 family protein [Paramagnetospirillum magnetotacticum]KIL97432.1 hypothetical protein CCC_00493 [Paramagnetospirillum magnetotacticum MS-1]